MNDYNLRPGEGLFSWLLLLFSLAVLYQAYQISGFESVSSPGAFPMAAGAVMFFSMIMIVGKNLRLAKLNPVGVLAELRQARADVLPSVVVIYIGVVAAYMFLIEPLRFLPSTFIFLLGSLLFLMKGGIRQALGISLGGLTLIYVVFHYIFQVILP